MTDVRFPLGFRIEPLRRAHRRASFRSGERAVDDWLQTKALQQQEKRLSYSKVLLDEVGAIVGYFTLAIGQVDFNDLPREFAKRLPRRMLPVVVLAWFGIDVSHQNRGLGGRLLAQALRDCRDAGKALPFVAIVLDCINDEAKSFYQRWQFEELPGHPYRLFLSAARLEALLDARAGG